MKKSFINGSHKIERRKRERERERDGIDRHSDGQSDA